jgi:hypothetical protein
MNLPSNCLRVIQAGKLDPQPPEERWLIRSLWGRTAVGFLAGPAKKWCQSTYVELKS